MGSVDHPFNPVSLALGAEATFVARTIDSDRKHLTEVLSAAAAHRGTSLVEIYQNCPIFNDGAFDALKDPEAADRLVKVEPGLSVTVDGQTWEHDPADPNPARQFALSRMELPQVPVGIFRQVSRPAYDDLARQQVATDLAGPRRRRPAVARRRQGHLVGRLRVGACTGSTRSSTSPPSCCSSRPSPTSASRSGCSTAAVAAGTRCSRPAPPWSASPSG